MGDKKVTSEYDAEQMRAFTLGVLNDLQALEHMLESGMFEEGVRRIGAEQEMFIVDSAMRPAPLIHELLEEAREPRLTTEIGKFNVEANLTARELRGSCLADMEEEIDELVEIARKAAAPFGAGIVLAGILPTIQLSDLTSSNLTADPRYKEIDRVVTELHGNDRIVQIKGLDELQLKLQDTCIEFSNTSFQVHLQVGSKDFASHYNWAQAIAAPVLASAVNSPFLLGKRLWHETRVALFQHATDTRSHVHKERSQPPRVNFGDRWVDNSVIEVLREDAIRFRILLTQAVEENSLETLADGRVPQLSAWRLHNGTIWRWNRACYGILNGKPGLRIEARYLPAGPSVRDEMANSAFFLGLMTSLPEEFGDVTKYMTFDDARNNFFNAARYGLSGQIRGLDGKSRRVGTLILEELLPRAHRGLEEAGVDKDDIDLYLGVLERRIKNEKTGALWMINSYAAMDERAKPNVKLRSLTAAMKANQELGLTVNDWPTASIPTKCDWIDNYTTVEQFMAVDLFTVRSDDVLDLAASLMHWRHVRHVPVEDDAGRLVGIISHRDLIELMASGKFAAARIVTVGDVMKTDLITVTPETSSLEALKIMRDHDIGCVPVVRRERLVGILTAHDFLTVSVKLFEERMTDVMAAKSHNG